MKIYIQRVNNFQEHEEVNLDGFLCMRFESKDGTWIDISFTEYIKNGIDIIGEGRLIIQPRAANHVWIETER